jgi:beta-1,4-mannosyltransferase
LFFNGLEDLGVEVDELTQFTRLSSIIKKYDIYHIHLPESVFTHQHVTWNMYKLLSFMRFVKLRGTRIVWSVHNLEPHENSSYDCKDYVRSVLRLADGVIFMNDSGRTLAIREFEGFMDKFYTVIPHGHYRGVYQNNISRAESRGKLGFSENERVILLFGKLSPYKGIASLIEAFKSLKDPDLRLVIAGKPVNEDYSNALRSISADDNRIFSHFVHIADDDVQLYMNSADLVVHPYLRSFTSGAAMLSLSFDKPILCANLGSMSDLEKEIRGDWVRLYEPPMTSEVLEEAINWAVQTDRSQTVDLGGFDWRLISMKTLEFYKSILELNTRVESGA